MRIRDYIATLVPSRCYIEKVDLYYRVLNDYGNLAKRNFEEHVSKLCREGKVERKRDDLDGRVVYYRRVE